MKNYPTSTLNCPECHTSKYTVYDPVHSETFCTKCGLIIQDTTIPGALHDYRKDKTKEAYIRSIWYKVKIYKGKKEGKI